MRGHTHIAGGVAAALVTTELTGLYKPETVAVSSLITLGVYLACAGTGALLPDIDTKQSKVSHKHKVISFFSRLFLTHRGFTHSALCMALFGLVMYFLTGFIKGGYGEPLFWGFLVGYGSHLILDAFNPKGIPLLYPWELRFSFGKIKTGGFWEMFVFLLMVLIILVCGYFIFGKMFHFGKILNWIKGVV
jgi:inner membrane protein